MLTGLPRVRHMGQNHSELDPGVIRLVLKVQGEQYLFFRFRGVIRSTVIV